MDPSESALRSKRIVTAAWFPTVTPVFCLCEGFPGRGSGCRGVVNVLFVESRAPDVEGGGVFGGFSFYCVVMALDGLVAPSVTGHLQAAYRPRDIEKQRKALIN